MLLQPIAIGHFEARALVVPLVMNFHQSRMGIIGDRPIGDRPEWHFLKPKMMINIKKRLPR